MNIFSLIVTFLLTLTPENCRGVVIEHHQGQEDPPSQFRGPNSESPLQHVKDLSDKQNKIDKNTRMRDSQDQVDEGSVAGAGPDEGSEKKSRVARSVPRSLNQTEPPASLVALLALDIIAALFAFHALAALLFILQS